MATIGDAVAAFGFADRGDEETVVVQIVGGKPRHYRLTDVAAEAVDEMSDVYVSSGSFVPGSVSATDGRKRANLRRIHGLPFDCDLGDFLSMDKQSVYALPQYQIDDYVRIQADEVVRRMSEIGLPVHRLAYTGHGVLALVAIGDNGPDDVEAIQSAHKALIAKLNDVARIKLADPQASDAGTRIIRLVDSLNAKSTEPRRTRMIAADAGVVTVAQLAAIAGQATSATPAVTVPQHARRLANADVAGIVNAVRPHWQHGQRHGVALGLAGILAKAGVPESQSLDIIEQISVGDDETWDRARAVETTYRRLEAGGSTRGFFALRDMLPPDVASYVDGVVASLRTSTTNAIIIHGTRLVESPVAGDDGETVLDIIPAPAICFRGWIADYVETMRPTTEASPQFHLAVGLTAAGALIGRSVSIGYGGGALFPNLYTLLVGRSGKTRKDTAMKLGVRLVSPPIMTEREAIEEKRRLATGRYVAPYLKVVTDVGSAEGLVSVLTEWPHTMLAISEFSRLMGNATRKATATITPLLMQAWDSPAIIETVTRANPLQAVYPFVSAIAATQPEILQSLMSEDDVRSGFANRWFIAVGPQTSPIPRPPLLTDDAVNQLRTALVSARDSFAFGTMLALDDAAERRWDEWYRADYARQEANADLDAMRVRHAVMINKVALIYAVSERSRFVTRDHLEAAIALLEWSWHHTAQLVGAWGTGVDNQIEQRIIAQLRKHGAMNRRRLTQNCSSKRWSGNDFARVIDNMLKNGIVGVGDGGLIGIARE